MRRDLLMTLTPNGYRYRKRGSLAKRIPFDGRSLEYKRAWARLNRRRVQKAWRLHEAKRRQSAEYRRRKSIIAARCRAKKREERNAQARAWRATHLARVRQLNQEYRRLMGMVCHFCGRLGSLRHPLRRIERMVVAPDGTWDAGEFALRRVLACHRCRG